MTTARFKVGDRVRARTTIRGVPAGTFGTIRRVVSSANDLYDVQFDDQPIRHVALGSELERANDEREATS
jgi:hypothetical protein